MERLRRTMMFGTGSNAAMLRDAPRLRRRLGDI